ncbi:MAG: Asp-tRNA(Asn)/Glu-tRNA(Gln) amidotransferase subunit GatA [Candidatus Omnitrophota bacterium]
MVDLISYSGTAIARAIKGNSSTRDSVYAFFAARAKKLNRSLNSFVEIYDEPVCGDGVSSLAGVPIAIKDNICLKGKKITCASKILSSHVSVYDATVVARLKKAGLAIIGTANMDEFAFGSSTENSCYGPAKNPWDTSRVPGGSSGGSAAIVAARLAPFALGSDTGGSIRQPAAFCGVVGLKPSYGRVSRYGLVAFGSSLDQIGPLTTNFIDCAHLLNIISGFDEHDSTSASVTVPDFSAALVEDVDNLKIGIPKEYYASTLAKDVKDAIGEVIAFFKKRGAQVIDITLPHTEYAVATYYIIGSSEASSNLQRFDGIKYGSRQTGNCLRDIYTHTRAQGFGSEAKRRIFLGTYSLSSGYYDAYYVRALKVRRLIKNDFDEAFKTVDVILTPTSPTPAFKIGEKTDPLSMYLSDIYTISANLAGIPAVSFPCGFTKDKLPIGAQLIGKDFDEATLIRAGYTFQCATDYHTQIPKIAYE